MVIGDFRVVAGLGTRFIMHLLSKHYGGPGFHYCPYTNEYLVKGLYMDGATYKMVENPTSEKDHWNKHVHENIMLSVRDIETHEYVRVLGFIKTLTGVRYKEKDMAPNMYDDGLLTNGLLSSDDLYSYITTVMTFNDTYGVHVAPHSRLALQTYNRYGLKQWVDGLLNSIREGIKLDPAVHVHANDLWDNHLKSNPEYTEVDYRDFHFLNKPSGTVLDNYFDQVEVYKERNDTRVYQPWKELLT